MEQGSRRAPFFCACAAISMSTNLRHFALSIGVGLVLAVMIGLAWWLGSLAYGAGPWDHALTIVPILVVGIVAAVGAGALVSMSLRASVVPEPNAAKAQKAPAAPVKP